MRRIAALTASLALLGAGLATASPASAEDKDKLVDRIVAKADPRNLEVLVTTRIGHGRPEFKTTRVPDVAAAKRFVAHALDQRNVVGVEMNRVIRYASGVPNDPGFADQWALDSAHLNFSAIRTIAGGDTVRPTVAIIDSGVQGSHRDLSASMVTSYDATRGQTISGTSAADACGHGTHVAGIVGASVNNAVGVAGLGRRVYIRSVKVLSKELLGGDCTGNAYDIANGVAWAADHASIINMSYAGTQSSPAEGSAIDYARSRGRILVAAAGDEGNFQKNFPASYTGVLGVGSVNSSYQWSSFSSLGLQVDVAAPGEGILSTVPTNSYAYYDGTSMAAPHVAALAALAIAHCRWSPGTTIDRIQRTASHFSSGRTAYTGYGVIQPVKLLRCV